MHPGEPYNPAAIERARQDLAAAGIFSAVNATIPTRLAADGTIPLNFTVTERPRHAVSVTAAYSTDLGPTAGATFTYRNVFGNAETLTLGAALTEAETGAEVRGIGYNLNATFVQPDWQRRGQTLTSNVGYVKENLYAYSRKAELAGVTLSRTLSDRWSASIGLTGVAERVTQEGVTTNYELAGLPLGLTYDSTGPDGLFNPTHGIKARLSVTPTEPFGGGSSFFTLIQLSGSTYLNLAERRPIRARPARAGGLGAGGGHVPDPAGPAVLRRRQRHGARLSLPVGGPAVPQTSGRPAAHPSRPARSSSASASARASAPWRSSTRARSAAPRRRSPARCSRASAWAPATTRPSGRSASTSRSRSRSAARTRSCRLISDWARLSDTVWHSGQAGIVMRTARGIVGWVFGVLVLVPAFAVLAAVLLLNLDPGRRLVERLAAQLTGGQVTVAGLSGRFPDALRLRHAEVRDAQGVWLSLDDVALDWSPLALLHREARIDLLQAGRVVVARLPVSSGPAQAAPADSKPFSLPVRVSVAALHVLRAEVGAPVAGAAAVLALDGNARLASLQDGDADVTIDRLDAPGSYAVRGRIDPAHLSATVRLSEPAHGLVAQIAKLPDIGAIALAASVDGPRDAEATDVTLSAGPLRAAAKGTVDIQGQSAALDLTADAPAMTPAPGVSWQSVALDAHVHGPFTRPDATGHVRLAGLSAGGASVALLAADLQGNQGAAGLRATVEGLRIPGPKPDLLAAAPLLLQADARLDTPARPVTFSLSHPLLTARGTANTGGDVSAHVDLAAPDLQPLAAAGGVDLQGRTQLAVDAAVAGGVTTVKLDGTVAVTGGLAPVPALLGDAATLGVTVALAGDATSRSAGRSWRGAR